MNRPGFPSAATVGSQLACGMCMLTGNPGHLKTFDYKGLYRYFLTFCTDQRRAIFTSGEVVEIVLLQILRAATDEQFAVIAYCFMPDHVHLLAEGQSETADCRVFISRAKQFAGFYYAKTHGARLWQRYGFEHVLRNDEATLGVARYIIENPVRAGLVSKPEDYPFSGSQMYTLADLIAAIADMRSCRPG